MWIAKFKEYSNDAKISSEIFQVCIYTEYVIREVVLTSNLVFLTDGNYKPTEYEKSQPQIYMKYFALANPICINAQRKPIVCKPFWL